MIYVDTSVWVSLLTHEPESIRVQQWFEQVSAQLISADWVLTEFHSAIAIKARTGQLSADQALVVLTLFQQLGAGGLTLVPVSRPAYRMAAALVDDFRHGLRGADALHLAVAQELTLPQFATLDRNQAANAQRLGFGLEFP